MRQLKITKQLTNRDTRAIEAYLKDVGKLKTVTPDEEIKLARMARMGNQAAMEKLFESNLRFVISVAKQYAGYGLTLDELIAEGNLGLYIAIQHFDETKGFKFISYAVWWIRQAIIQAIAEYAKFFRLPLNKVSTLQKARNIMSLLEHKLGRTPTVEELAREMDLPVPLIKTIKKFINKHTSLSAPIEDKEDTTLEMLMEDPNAVKPHDATEKQLSNKEIIALLSILTPQERKIIIYSYGLLGCDVKSCEEIALEVNLSPERVRQIRDKALKKLKDDSTFSFLRIAAQ